MRVLLAITNISRRELAQKLGVTPNSVCHCVDATHRISETRARQVAEILGVEVGAMVGAGDA
jgi:plasmid maintenance system antidote protein VapI